MRFEVQTVVLLHIICWVVLPCQLLDPEDKGSMMFKNVRICLPRFILLGYDTASLDNWIQMFQGNRLFLSSKIEIQEEFSP
jgi:hypothetical protein